MVGGTALKSSAIMFAGPRPGPCFGQGSTPPSWMARDIRVRGGGRFGSSRPPLGGPQAPRARQPRRLTTLVCPVSQPHTPRLTGAVLVSLPAPPPAPKPTCCGDDLSRTRVAGQPPHCQNPLSPRVPPARGGGGVAKPGPGPCWSSGGRTGRRWGSRRGWGSCPTKWPTGPAGSEAPLSGVSECCGDVARRGTFSSPPTRQRFRPTTGVYLVYISSKPPFNRAGVIYIYKQDNEGAEVAVSFLPDPVASIAHPQRSRTVFPANPDPGHVRPGLPPMHKEWEDVATPPFPHPVYPKLPLLCLR